MFQAEREIDPPHAFSLKTSSIVGMNENNFSFHNFMTYDHSEVECVNLPLNDIGNKIFREKTSAFFPSHLDRTSDFEFDMPLAEPETSDCNASPADELFFKGQLLPLHLPPRLQMVQSLSCVDKESGMELANEEEKSDSFSFKACDLNHKHSDGCFCSPDTFSPDFLWRDSRSSSLSSQFSSFWDSGDKDSLDSSCRDSNGSSQDSYISGKDMQPDSSMEFRSKQVSENANMFRLDYCYSQNHNCQSSWLRTPFRWKSLLGSKKAAQIKLNSNCGQKSSNGDKRKATVGSRSYDPNSLGLARPFLMSSFLVSEKSVRQPRRNSSRNFQAMGNSNNSKSLDRNHKDGKASGVWNRYMKLALKPTANSSSYGDARVSEKHDPWQMCNDRALKTDIFDASKVKITAAAHDVTSERTPSCSFLSGNLNLRISSFSRRSSTPTSRVNSSRSSPNHSGVLVPTPSYNDTMTELHSAIQGAIAHCKQYSQPPPQLSSQKHPVTISKILQSSTHHSK